MFCPQCGAEYREGFTECWDCGVALTKEPPPEPAPVIHDDDSKFVEVYRAAGAFEGAFFKSVLEGSDIECVLSGSSGGGAYPVNVGSLGVVRVMVKEDNAGEARRLIEAASEGDLELEE